MPDEPETPPPYGPSRRVPTGLAGETTRGENSTIGPAASQPLEVIGDFEVLSKLGQGGMGAVYRVRQVSLDRQVALKLLPANCEADAKSVARFEREARVAANLKHPNLVRVYTSGVADGTHYIAMELIEGETLAQWVRRGALPPLEALRITLDVARALEYGWRTAQLIHRDIKPGNIFLSQEGEVKLGDLGLAKLVDSDTTGLTQTGVPMGTAHYISPEQSRGEKDLDFRADIYSLGCTLYQMLTRHTPYSGTDPIAVMSLHRDGPPPAILKVMPQCPVPLARLVAKMLRKQRRERPASYEELIAQIESVRAQLDPAVMAEIRAAASAPVPTVATPAQTGAPSGAQSGGGFQPPIANGEAAGMPLPHEGRLGEPSLPKSRVPLYGGIAAAVLVLGLVGWLVWPKEEKLTKAQIYAREHAAVAGVNDPGGPASLRPATTTPADATKDAPFVNTLGMKFVPVPIVGRTPNSDLPSPTPVLFGVWDTRVQDYEAFVKETKREWPKADVEQGPLYPAVNVSWEDAQAFCQWLTERERKAGRLGGHRAVGACVPGTDGAVPSNEPPAWVYRLPTDHEWSCAVGLGAREDPAKLPTEKSDKINDVFPWGTEWPPPKGAGNYAGEELRPALAAGKYTYIKDVFAGYDDGFVSTSPVGSFAANRYGLYDMGGNVWQWCEDWFDKEQKGRVTRGASWDAYSGRYLLLSSNRAHGGPTHRFYGTGFRCVLGVSAR